MIPVFARSSRLALLAQLYNLKSVELEKVWESRMLCSSRFWSFIAFKGKLSLLSFIISASTLPPTSCIPLFIGITSAVEATQKGGSNFCFHSGNTPKSKLISCLLVY